MERSCSVDGCCLQYCCSVSSHILNLQISLLNCQSITVICNDFSNAETFHPLVLSVCVALVFGAPPSVHIRSALSSPCWQFPLCLSTQSLHLFSLLPQTPKAFISFCSELVHVPYSSSLFFSQCNFFCVLLSQQIWTVTFGMLVTSAEFPQFFLIQLHPSLLLIPTVFHRLNALHGVLTFTLSDRLALKTDSLKDLNPDLKPRELLCSPLSLS